MTKFLVLLSVVIVNPAWAIDPAYLGIWAPSPKECRDGGRAAFRITQTAAYGREWRCDIKQASSDGAGWRVHLSCAQEGTESTPTWRWQLAPNGHLHETQEGQSSDYVRRKDSDYR